MKLKGRRQSSNIDDRRIYNNENADPILNMMKEINTGEEYLKNTQRGKAMVSQMRRTARPLPSDKIAGGKQGRLKRKK